MKLNQLNFKILNLFFLLLVLSCYNGTSQKKHDVRENILSKSNLEFLRRITKDVVDSSHIYPGQVVSSQFGPNNTGGSLIRPGGRDSYPSFWIRDYAMSIECGFINFEEQKHMLLLTASTQCDQSWITMGGSIEHIGVLPLGGFVMQLQKLISLLLKNWPANSLKTCVQTISEKVVNSELLTNVFIHQVIDKIRCI